MKKYTLPATAAMLALSLTACAFSGEEMQSSAAAPAASSAPAAVQQAAPGSHKILIAYFAYGENAEIPDGADASASASIQPAADGMTGNTGLVAREIQKSAGGELFSIRTEAPYPASYDATVEQGRQEQQQNARPALASHIEDPASYDVIFWAIRTGGAICPWRCIPSLMNTISPARPSFPSAPPAAAHYPIR